MIPSEVGKEDLELQELTEREGIDLWDLME